MQKLERKGQKVLSRKSAPRKWENWRQWVKWSIKVTTGWDMKQLPGQYKEMSNTAASVSSSHNIVKTTTWVGQNYLTGSSGTYLTDSDFTLMVKQKKPMWSKSSGNSNRAAWCKKPAIFAEVNNTPPVRRHHLSSNLMTQPLPIHSNRYVA